MARFKRFKGLGFEAELWEDKQKEAADLIDRLKSVVSIYTREIVMNVAMRGRWDDGGNWKAIWKLYDDLVGQHDALGQKIDFTDLKRKLDGIFLFDICSRLSSSVQDSIQRTWTRASDFIMQSHSSPISELERHNREMAALHEISYSVDGMFERAERENIAQEILDKAVVAAAAAEREFSFKTEFDPIVMAKLERLAKLHSDQPIEITDELIQWADAEPG